MVKKAQQRTPLVLIASLVSFALIVMPLVGPQSARAGENDSASKADTAAVVEIAETASAKPAEVKADAKQATAGDVPTYSAATTNESNATVSTHSGTDATKASGAAASKTASTPSARQAESAPVVDTRTVSLNTQLQTINPREWTRIPNAVSVAKNIDTGVEYTFKMGSDSSIPRLKLPVGKYEIRVVSVPQDDPLLKGKTYVLPEPKVEEIKTSTGMAVGWTITVKEVETKSVSVNTQLRDKDGNYVSIPDAVSVARNLDTGETFTFTMGPTGDVPFLELPVGKYELSLRSVPQDGALLQGKTLEMPASVEYEVSSDSVAYGWTMIVKEAVSDPSPAPGEVQPDNNSGTNPETKPEANSGNMDESAQKLDPQDSEKKTDVKDEHKANSDSHATEHSKKALPQTGDTSNALVVAAGLLFTVAGAAGVLSRRRESSKN